MKYFCKVRYDGTNFCGYQLQPDKRTVQGVLSETFCSLFGTDVTVTGCSRTDSGVHADMFCLTAALPDFTLPIPPERLPLAMQTLLPSDVSLYEACAVPDDFHPRYDVKMKTYIYKMYASRIHNPFYENRAWQVKYSIDTDKMQAAAEHFIGTHDFSALMAAGSDAESTVRTVYESRVDRDGENVTFTVSADGFLYNMVRIMVGTLLAVGVGRIKPDDIPKILENGDRTAAGETAPPYGLYLHSVDYGFDG